MSLSRASRPTLSLFSGSSSTSASVRHSHIGSALLRVPSSTSIEELPFPPLSNPLRAQPASLRNARSLLISGPKGKVVLPLQGFVQMHWLDPSASSGEGGAADGKASAKEEDGKTLQLSVQDATSKPQRSTWGLMRALLANALTGVSQGHSVSLKLVGVGYRAVLEVDPFPRPSALATALGSSRAAFSSPAQRDAYAAFAAAEAAAREKAPPMRLNIKLGYSHPVILPIPHGIEVAVPQPTVIELKGVDREKLGLFASQIRKWREPEPYKGKGIFVDGETIKLRTAKKK